MRRTLPPVGLLEVDSVGLRILAARCSSWGAELGSGSAPGQVVISGQATAAAVAAGHAGVAIAGKAMAARMKETAAKLSTAGGAYVVTDMQSANTLRGLGV